MRNRTERRDSGFALLFVFLMAAAIAITLYMELPRVAFEARRAREQLLIDRGEEYRRAIQLYYRKMKVYPPNLEALENTNNFRFLRRRYKDPMTGEDEWRLIHVGPGGVLTDSLVQKPPGKQAEEAKSPNTYITELPSVGATVAIPGSGPGGMPPRRASEGGPQLPVEGVSTLPPPETPAQPTQPTASAPQPGFVPFAPIGVAGQAPSPSQPGQQPIGIYPQLVPGQPPTTPGQQQFQPVMPVPGLSAPSIQPPGQQFGQATGGEIRASLPFQAPTGQAQGGPFMPSAGGAGPQAGQGQNPAVALIQRLLTTPHPQGIAALQQAPVQQGGTGIAGVASKLEADSIKVYNDRSKYQEWEFIYDPRMDRTNVAAAQRGPGGPAAPGQPQPGGVGPAPQQPGMLPQQPGMFPQTPVPGGPGLRRLQ